VKRFLLPILILAIATPAMPMGPMRFEHRFRWGWGDVILFSVAVSTLVFGALLANTFLLGASLLAIGLGLYFIQSNSPQWWRGAVAFALLLLAFAVLTGAITI